MFERPVAGQISGQANWVHLEIMKRQNRWQQLDQEQGTVVVQPKHWAAAVRQFPEQAGSGSGQVVEEPKAVTVNVTKSRWNQSFVRCAKHVVLVFCLCRGVICLGTWWLG